MRSPHPKPPVIDFGVAPTIGIPQDQAETRWVMAYCASEVYTASVQLKTSPSILGVAIRICPEISFEERYVLTTAPIHIMMTKTLRYATLSLSGAIHSEVFNQFDRPTGNGSESRFTIIRTNNGIQQAVTDIPDVSDLSLVRIGQVEARDDTSPLLIDSQTALPDLAIREGYYEVPRETTHRDLADSLGVTPGTVSDRLQRIERRVMAAYAMRSDQ